jgi:hypothetical protein
MLWFNLLMLLLRAAAGLFGWLRDRQLIKAGEDAAVARAAKELLERTETGKRLREQVKALSPAEEDDLWDRMIRQ